MNTQHKRVTVTVHGKPAAVLVSIDDLEALEEAVSLLTNEESVRDLISSEAELARGEVITAEELAVAMSTRRRHAS